MSSSLVPNLIAASRSNARLAMELRSDHPDPQNRLRAATAVGVAVELALKATVATVLPSLLAKNGDTHSQLFLMGQPGLHGKSQSDVRTIGGTEAWQIITSIRPKLAIGRKDVQAALGLRNGAVHLALVEPTDLADGVRAMAICIDRLLPELRLTPSAFWGTDFEDQATALIKEVLDARELRVAQAKSSALLQLARMQALGVDAFEAIVATLSYEGYEPEDEGDSYGEPHQCPVCEHTGWLSGVIERGDLQVEGEHHDYVWVDRLFVPQEFSCEVCGLTVGDQELPLFGLPSTRHLDPDDDPWELRAKYEEAQAEAAFEAMRDAR